MPLNISMVSSTVGGSTLIGWNLRSRAYAATYTYQDIPEYYYYKYINPNAESGISEEEMLTKLAPKHAGPNSDYPAVDGQYLDGSPVTVDELLPEINEQHATFVEDCAISKFTGNNEIILLGIQVGNVYLINSAISADNTIKGQYDCIRNAGDSTSVLFVNMTLKSTGSEYVYGGISSSKAVSFTYNSSKTIQGIGTYYIYYLEKKHV